MMRKHVLFAHLIAMFVIVLVYGAIPYLSIPTLGQVVWTSGFAESFNRAGWPSTQAVNFGIPERAPIAFGLDGAFLQSTLMQLKMPAADAYAAGAVIWLGLAFCGTIGLARMLGAGPATAPYLSLIYLTLPLVWGHAGYSMLSFGFALMPMYLYCAFRLTYRFTGSRQRMLVRGLDVLLFVVVSFLAIFMDGYTYVMFYFATVIIFVVALLRGDVPRFRAAIANGPIIFATGAASYLAYTHYVGTSWFQAAPIDFFRAWGVDVAMLLVPTHSVSWLCDALHLSVRRTYDQFYGDGSVWMTTFCAPLLILGAFGFAAARRHRFALPLLIIAVVGMYLALGPSVKFNSQRPPNEDESSIASGLMPAERAWMPTGNAWLYKRVPGFKSMRATYRWCALSLVGLFGLAVLLLNELSKQNRTTLTGCITVAVIGINLPNLPHGVKHGVQNRQAMERMIADLEPLAASLRGRRVVFYPSGNDFLANLLSANGNFYTYNVGGDKNLEMAQRSWPRSVRDFAAAPFKDCFNLDIARILLSGDVDAVVIPYFHMFWHAFAWPPDEETSSRLEKITGSPVQPATQVKGKYASVAAALSRDSNFVTQDTDLYATVSLCQPPDQSKLKTASLSTDITFENCSPGLVYLGPGWSWSDPSGSWSDGDVATMSLNLDSRPKDLAITIAGWPFVNDQHAFQEMELGVNGHLLTTLEYRSSGRVSNVLHLPRSLVTERAGSLNIRFRFKDPRSPAELGISDDPRKLGFHLESLKVDDDTLEGIDSGTKVTFEKGSKALRSLESGWCLPGEAGTWSEGDIATMRVRVNGEFQGDRTLTIDGAALINDRHPMQKVEVSIDREVLATLQYTSPARVSNAIKVPQSLLKKDDGVLSLRFRLWDPKSPAELGMSVDQRKLGLFLMSLEVN
jgi:hypothetical protein